MQWLSNSWYQAHPLRWLLWPLSLFYRLVITLRKLLYSLGIFKQTTLPVPVIIVGNITVGGTGKTPFVIWLAQQLKKAGFKPGIISRGYGGQADHYPQLVTADSDPKQVGDEPVIISRHTDCPIAVAPKRVAAAQQLLQDYACDMIISDDGLQHYALNRDIEIVIVDGQRQYGNKLCLPAGPLREPLTRLNLIDIIVANSADASSNEGFIMQLKQVKAVNLVTGISKNLAEFKNNTVHAIAGIGNPQRFFDQLASQSIMVEPHPFSDHHYYDANEVNFNDDKPILMTEKDAVKCQAFATDSMWFIAIEASIDGKLMQQLTDKLAGTKPHG